MGEWRGWRGWREWRAVRSRRRGFLFLLRRAERRVLRRSGAVGSGAAGSGTAVQGQPVLVIENKDTYWSFGEWNATARRYSAVVYGGGEAFQSTGLALAQTMPEVGADHAMYFGDLDPKGIRIPVDFNRKTEPGQPQIAPAMEIYSWLTSNGVRSSREAPSMG